MEHHFHTPGDRWFGRVNSTLLVLLAVLTLLPIVYVISVSVSGGLAASEGRVWLWPVDLSTAAYSHVMKDKLFWTSYANTIFYTLAGTLTSLLLIVPAAYALSKPRLRGRRVIGFFIAFTMWFHAGMIPYYLNVREFL
jgi:putative aldouronate transport system permease protein